MNKSFLAGHKPLQYLCRLNRDREVEENLVSKFNYVLLQSV